MTRDEWKAKNIKIQYRWDPKETLAHSMVVWARLRAPAALRHVLDNDSVAFQMCLRMIEGMRISGYTIRKPRNPNQWGKKPDGKPVRDDVII